MARRTRWLVIGGVLAALATLLLLVDPLIDEPFRRRMEQELNARLTGYRVSVRRLDYHFWNFSLDLKDAIIVQEANPDPPVAHIRNLAASVHWRALLRGALVANFRVDEPSIHFDRRHFEKEATDEVPIERRGWQDALTAIYPLKINEFVVANGELTYVDDGPFEPLHLRQVNFKATNIRNVHSEERVYPSEIHLDAAVFDAGTLRLDGHADFLAVPHLGVQGHVSMERIALGYFTPITRRYNLAIRQGVLAADGELEYAPTVKVVSLDRVTIDTAEMDYTHTAPTKAAEKEVARTATRVAKEVENQPGVLLRIGTLTVTSGTFGFVNRAQQPPYRVFLTQTELTVQNLTNHRTQGTAVATLHGKLMGTGATQATATFRPELKGADFDLGVRVENTQMAGMNDLLRAYGKFDVVGGLFSLYSELRVKDGRISGYVKPLFRDLDVYDRHQDAGKGWARQLYERMVGGVSKLLENDPRDEVATKGEVIGQVGDAKMSTGDIIVGLIQNAFFKAILPGFDQELRRLRR
jgi:hypothetical protein